MRIKNLFLMAMIFFMAGGALADTITNEAANVQKYVNGLN